ncbi:MAG: antibiotic biosynthesis monooxygenase [Chloroflexi bacterium]|nr:antibiotic biosynthesis monooxygenase [Chloroflexota bacterium]
MAATDSAAVVDVSRYYPGPGQGEALLDAMRRVASKASAAEGCFGAQVCQSDQDGEALVAISRWASASAMEAFANSSAFVEEREHFASLLARPAQREHLRPV